MAGEPALRPRDYSAPMDLPIASLRSVRGPWADERKAVDIGVHCRKRR